MKVEVWTDIMCPYCHIGKIHYEKALKQFAHADEVELVIKAFQLNPDLPGSGNGIPVTEYLTRMTGSSESSIRKMFSNMEQLAKNAGIKSRLPEAVAANTLDAHRLIKLAAEKGEASEVMHKLTQAYFEDAQDYSDIGFLVKTGILCGLNETEIREMLHGERFKKEVRNDVGEANALGIDTVPTFLFDRRQAIIGIEPVEVFLEVLNKTYEIWKNKAETSRQMDVKRGKSCNAHGVCKL